MFRIQEHQLNKILSNCLSKQKKERKKNYEKKRRINKKREIENEIKNRKK